MGGGLSCNGVRDMVDSVIGAQILWEDLNVAGSLDEFFPWLRAIVSS